MCRLFPSCLILWLAVHGATAKITNLNNYGPWKTGRATHYGTDAWSIHSGSCGYGHLSPGEPLGWNVAAMADVNDLYPKGVCGFCLEVHCAPLVFKDNYGMQLDRTHVCYQSNSSLVVRITDTCPCTYAPNSYSNKRWCCGDMDHLDLSYVTFRTIAPLEQGVIGIRYRQVPCGHTPAVRAVQPPYYNEDPSYNPWAPRPLRDWPEYMKGRPQPPLGVFFDSLGPRWRDVSWRTWVMPQDQVQTVGKAKTPALCAKLSLNGALALEYEGTGAFVGRVKVSFWMYVNVAGADGRQAQVADITIGLSGPKGPCSRPRIWSVSPILFYPSCPYCTDYWWYFELYLGGFTSGGNPRTPMRPTDFQGCGGNTAAEVNRLEFRHDGYGGLGDKYMCLDDVMVV